MKIFAFILCLVATFFLSAQVVVESPETDALLTAQMLLINELAAGSRASETERFIEYLAQFANVIGTIKKGQEAAAKVLKIGNELKNKSAEEWLSDVENGLKETFPEMSDFLSPVGDEAGKSAVFAGKYAEYVSNWSARLGAYHDELLENYGNHTVFPELFPAAAQSGKDFIHAESAQKIVHKAWLESGMEYEMKNDAVRGEMFRRYYEEYLKDARENDNIEALGLANLMQAGYISAETLEHIRKNLDLKVMKEQFDRDSSESYLRFLSDENKEGNSQKSSKKKSIFGL
ncbi:hypothetical protein J6Z19_05550 [bacterium]|nr:hypothetical protein [bacterium]